MPIKYLECKRLSLLTQMHPFSCGVILNNQCPGWRITFGLSEKNMNIHFGICVKSFLSTSFSCNNDYSMVLLKELHSDGVRCVCSNIVTRTSSSINSENKSGTTRSIQWRRLEFPGNSAAVLVTVSHEEQLVWPTPAINLSISPAGIRFITMQQGETLHYTEHQAQLHAPSHISTKLTLFPLRAFLWDRWYKQEHVIKRHILE